ncbi:flagellar protein FliT [Bacillus sp. V3B]|uniref:flagellar protein FliT n=1 Tax=Bacillus sp. V3B TaxID=2804915 RepID=UPI00210B23F0|nr:flagellar protein FliT [Bacillus sp. V3B]MCQ6277159.1 flagellar protein FliT [Bacillus sp. V3B]
MGVVKGFYEATVELIQLLSREDQKDRDVKIKRIEELLEKREGFMKSMKPPFSQAEQQLGKQLVKLDQQLTKLLEKEKTMIQKDIKNLSKKKQSTAKYNNPYESLITDGVFYDKRN